MKRQNYHVADVGPAGRVHAADDPARLVETVTAEEQFTVEFMPLRKLCETKLHLMILSKQALNNAERPRAQMDRALTVDKVGRGGKRVADARPKLRFAVPVGTNAVHCKEKGEPKVSLHLIMDS